MKIIKKYMYNILSFLVPIIVLTTIYIFKELFTKYDYLTSDSISQFYPTYKYLYNVLHGTASFPYTFSKGLGGSMYGAFFYGLSSPTNFLVYFFKDVRLFMLISTFIKIGLSGLTMYILLKSQKNSKKNSFFFAIAYALSGYVIVYGINIMWLDSIWLAPLVIKGIDNIINNKNDKLYITTILITLISNYYTGYMVVLFSFIYFIYKLYISYDGKHFFKDNKKMLGHFFIINMLMGGMICFILIPVFIESRNFMRIDLNQSKINLNYQNFFAGTYIGFGSITNPVNYFGILLYCGTIILPLIIYYFTSNSFNKREKRAAIVVYILFLLPVIISPLSAVWHLFTYPQGFNFRYSFLTILFTLLLSIKSFEKMDGNKKAIKLFCYIYILIGISMCYCAKKIPVYYNYLEIKNFVITFIFLIINVILILKKKKNIILFLLLIELITNASMIYAFNSKFAKCKNSADFIKYAEKMSNYRSEKYRIEFSPTYTSNNSLTFNYYGLSSFLSSNNKNNIKPYHILLGEYYRTNYITYDKKNTLTDTILGIKYSFSDYQNINYKNINNTYIYDREGYFEKNPIALSIGYSASNKIKELNTKKYEKFDFLNKLLNSIYDKYDNYFIKLNVKKINDKKYEIEKNKEYPEIYMLTDSLPANIENKDIFFSIEYSILYLNEKGNINLEFDEKTEQFEAYVLDYDKLKELTENIGQYNITKNKDNVIEGTIESNNKVFMTTIPYEKGWTILVDGKKTTYYKALDIFIAFDIEEGKHEIIFKYNIPGLKISIIVSLLSTIALIIYKLKYNIIK